MKTLTFKALALFIATTCGGATCALFAQIRSGTITGTVTDASGGAIVNASVEVSNQQTGVVLQTKTTDAGSYTVPYLPAGTYTVSVKGAGFAPFLETGIGLETGQTARVDVGLKVGSIESAVQVTASAQQLQTESSTVQGSTQSDLIQAIPNPDQNPLYYIALQAGVAPRNATADTTSLNSFGIGVNGRREFSAIGVNGGRAFTNDIQLDGLPVMAGGYNETSVVPNTERLQEVRVIANDFSAEYGHGQAVFSMNTKSARTNTTARPITGCATKLSMRTATPITRMESRGLLSRCTNSAAPWAGRFLRTGYSSSAAIITSITTAERRRC